MSFCAILFPKSYLKENSMGFKKIDRTHTFADAILKDSTRLDNPSKFASQFHRTGGQKSMLNAHHGHCKIHRLAQY